MTDLETALQQLKARADAYQVFSDYYAGRHRLAFATDKFLNAFGRLFRAFASNHCRSVISAVADRLEVEGFGVQGSALPSRRELREQRRREAMMGSPSSSAPPDAGDEAWSIWTWNRMGQDASEVHLEALRTGDSYVIVWPAADSGMMDNEPARVTLYPQKAQHVTVRYDEERRGLIRWAAKGWSTHDERFRLTLYYPDRLEKWITRQRVTGGMIPEKQGAFEEYQEEGPNGGVLPWPRVNEWGQVPVFHFANGAPVGGMGASELVDVIPLQDALNKSIADLLVGMEYVSLPQRWVTGLEVEIDKASGKPKEPFRTGVDKLWTAEDKDTRFGQFEPASFEQMLKVQDSFRSDIARVSGTPMHYMMLMTDPPSGEALKTLEARLVKKVIARQTAWGDTWKDALQLALRMSGQAEVALTTEWADPAPKSERELAETTGLLVSAGASLYAAAKTAGYDEVSAQELNRVDLVGGVAQ